MSCKSLPRRLSQHFDYDSEVSQGHHWFFLFIQILDSCIASNSNTHKHLEAVGWWCAGIPIILQKQAVSALISFSSMINSYEVYWLRTAPNLTIKCVQTRHHIYPYLHSQTAFVWITLAIGLEIKGEGFKVRNNIGFAYLVGWLFFKISFSCKQAFI